MGHRKHLVVLTWGGILYLSKNHFFFRGPFETGGWIVGEVQISGEVAFTLITGADAVNTLKYREYGKAK